jgi:hypothetical protein
MEAIVAVRKLTLLYIGVAGGSRNMVDCLKIRKQRTNIKIGAVAAVCGFAAIYAALYFCGPAGWAAAGGIFNWVTVAEAGSALKIGGSAAAVASAGSAVTLGIKMPWEGARFEKSKLRTDSNTGVSLIRSDVQSSNKDKTSRS